MEQNIIIRREEQKDWEIVENITREAFYNLYVPGCVEHYLVHIMRKHEDFIPELDFVLELNGHVIGNIMYTKAKLIDENGIEKEILTFGPVSILPAYQRMGYGKMLMEYSFEAAIQLGYDTLLLFLEAPAIMSVVVFKAVKNIMLLWKMGRYPAAMMVKELSPHALDGHKWIYRDSPVMAISEEEAELYDNTLEPLEKKYLPSQEEFYIMSHSFVEE